MDAGRIYSLLVLVVVIVVATYTELQESRIPNWLTLPALGIGLLLGYFNLGMTLGASVTGFLVGFGTLFVFYMFGGMGGGDVKLMGAVGALFGYPDVLSVLVYTAFIGGAMALVALIWQGDLLGGLRRAFSMFVKTGPGPQLDDVDDEPGDSESEKSAPVTIPYGLAIVGGCVLHFLLQAERVSR